MNITIKDSPIFTLDNGLSLAASYNLEGQRPLSYSLDGNILNATFEKGTITDEIIAIKDNSLAIKRTWTLEPGDYNLEACFTALSENLDQVFVPAVYYKGNLRGKGHFPTEKISRTWEFLESRASIPACVCLYNQNHFFSCAIRSRDIQCSSTWKENSILFHIPGAEGPYSYKGKNLLVKEEKNEKKVKVKPPFSRSFLIYFDRVELFSGYESFVSLFQNQVHFNNSCSNLSLSDQRALLYCQLLSLIRIKDDKQAYLVMGMENGVNQNVYDFTAASFLVKSLEAAVCLAGIDENEIIGNASETIQNCIKKQKLKLNNLAPKTLATMIAYFFFQAERQEGVYQDCHNLKTGEWGGYLGLGEHPEFSKLVNSRCNGEAMLSYLKLYSILKDPRYLNLCKRVADFYISCQEADGNFGRWWTVDRKSVNKEGTNGAYILIFLCRLYEIAPSQTLADSIEKAGSYYSNLIAQGLFYGDTLDADSCDKEAGEVLLRSMLCLLENKVFSRPEYYQNAQKAAAFLLSWIWQDDLVFNPNTPLGQRDFHTRGMTSASVANQHLDDYGMMIAHDFLRLYRLCPKEIYLKQAKMMINASLQLISNPDDNLGRNELFYGWQPEQINHTSWDYFNSSLNQNGYFAIHIAWVNVLVFDYLNQNIEFKKEHPSLF